MTLKGEIALVTGASRGIGLAIALELGRRGARVVGTATSANGADAIGKALAAQGVSGRGAVLNVTDPASIEALLKDMETHGGMPSILVNNAGITRDNLLLRMSEDEWDAILDTNLKSVFRMTKACLRAMTKARKGRIISISSVVGATGNPGQVNYAAAKAGIVGFTKALAREVFIDTDMTRALPEATRAGLLDQIPLGRLGSPEDIAATVAFLASPAAGYITGVTLHVNGGMFMN